MEKTPIVLTQNDLLMLRRAVANPNLAEGYLRVVVGEEGYMAGPALVTAAFQGLLLSGLNEEESTSIVTKGLRELGVSIE